MIELTTNDLHFVVSRIPKDVRKILKNNRMFLAGGFIRANVAGEIPSDIDLLGAEELELKSAAWELSGKRSGRVYETDNAFTVIAPPRKTVQFIRRWLYSDPEKLISEFDFTIVQAVIWWQPNKDAQATNGEWRSMCSEHFYTDLAARRLVYTHPDRHEDAGGSILRMIKYIKRGYCIQVDSIAGVVARLIRDINLSNEDIIERVTVKGKNGHPDKEVERLNEEWSRKILSGLLREVDPLIVIDGIDLIDESGNDMDDEEPKPDNGAA